MRRLTLLFGILSTCAAAFAQSAATVAPLSPANLTPVPVAPHSSTGVVPHVEISIPQPVPRSAFVKDLTVDSFGIDASPLNPGYEFTPGSAPSDGPSSAPGLGCPRCTPHPAMNRARFSLPAFGAEATYRPWGNRSELFAGFGGVEAWRPDNTIEPSRRDSTYNDEWLTQAWARARIALDKNRHLWLGVTRRYVSNFGQGQQHWNTIAGDATYSFGH